MNIKNEYIYKIKSFQLKIGYRLLWRNTNEKSEQISYLNWLPSHYSNQTTVL